MRFAVLLSLASCMTQGSFAVKFEDAYCDAYAYCDSSGRPCPVRLEDDRAYKACDFDADLAKACLDGPYTCNDDVEGFEVLEVPQACLNVCGGVE